MTGKPYANRKKKKDRPKGDFYGTPISLLWELYKKEHELIDFADILEPACGTGNLSNELIKQRYVTRVTSFDLYQGKYKTNFLDYKEKHELIITNPPFSEFDDFVMHSKTIAKDIMMIGKTNFFGAYKRNQNGIWKGLKKLYIFNRQVDYRSEYRKDGKFKCGNLVTGWFIWDNSHFGKCQTEIMDVNKYVLKKGE